MFAIALNSPAVFLSICMRLHLCACRLLGRIYAPDDIVVVALLPPPYLFNCERTHPIQLATYEPLTRRYHQCLQPLLALHQANTFVCKGKAKVCNPPRRVWEGCSSPFLRPWARRWINHWSLWRMVSATPDLWLPSQSQGIAAAWPVPNYTAWW